MRVTFPRSVAFAVALGVGLASTGCGNGVDESDITANTRPPDADAPTTPAEYDAKHPVANAGDSPKAGAKGRGRAVTNP